MKEILLVKYGEIILKGLNRSRFEDMLIGNIKKALPKDSYKCVRKSQAITYVEPAEGADVDDIVDRLKKVFGIV
ncbi:MAG: tRNA 4-thiouridine(8) synthase ThiI, partial [Clostridia bacterium]